MEMEMVSQWFWELKKHEGQAVGLHNRSLEGEREKSWGGAEPVAEFIRAVRLHMSMHAPQYS